MTFTDQITEERRHFIPEAAAPDSQTARLRDVIALIDRALTEAYHADRAARAEARRSYDRETAA